MSRIGLQPIAVPSTVKLEREDSQLAVTGPKGTLRRSLPAEIEVRQENGSLLVSRKAETAQARALHGLTRSLVANMVRGVTEGYSKTLEIQGVGYRATLAGQRLTLAVGFSHPVEVEAREGITFEVGQETNTRNFLVKVSGIDKELVGQTAAEIRGVRKPEPYKGKGIRYQGEQVRRKAGKSAKGAKGK
jgi:large subunit ribosomal protein L6